MQSSGSLVRGQCGPRYSDRDQGQREGDIVWSGVVADSSRMVEFLVSMVVVAPGAGGSDLASISFLPSIRIYAGREPFTGSFDGGGRGSPDDSSKGSRAGGLKSGLATFAGAHLSGAGSIATAGSPPWGTVRCADSRFVEGLGTDESGTPRQGGIGALDVGFRSTPGAAEGQMLGEPLQGGGGAGADPAEVGVVVSPAPGDDCLDRPGQPPDGRAPGTPSGSR